MGQKVGRKMTPEAECWFYTRWVSVTSEFPLAPAGTLSRHPEGSQRKKDGSGGDGAVSLGIKALKISEETGKDPDWLAQKLQTRCGRYFEFLRLRAAAEEVERWGVKKIPEERSSNQARGIKFQTSPQEDERLHSRFSPRGPQRATPAGRSCQRAGAGLPPLSLVPSRGRGGCGSRAVQGRWGVRSGRGQSSLEVWEAEPLKPSCPLEALRKSDCDLFGLVTIQVSGRQLFIRCGSLTNWLGSAREDNPSDPGRCWGGKRNPPTCSLPRAARTSAEMRISTCGCAAASYPPQPARIPSPGWRGLGCSRQALSREISAPSAAEPSPQVPGRSPKLRSALQVTQF